MKSRPKHNDVHEGEVLGTTYRAKTTAIHHKTQEQMEKSFTLSMRRRPKLAPRPKETEDEEEGRRSSSALSAGKGGVGRASLQDYTKCVHYGTATFWAGELSTEALATLLVGLGLRNPTEPTMQLATAVYLINSQGLAGALALSNDSAMYTYRAVKKTFKHKCKGAPLQYLQSLPASPAAFKSSHSSMYDTMFATEYPVPCPDPARSPSGC